MRKQTKIGVALALAMALALPCQMAFAGPGDPPNTSDEVFAFSMVLAGSEAYEVGRDKNDASSTYVRVTNKSMDSYKMFVDGSNVNLVTVPWSNQTTYWVGTAVGNSATVSSLGEFQIMNNYRRGFFWILESG